MLYEFPASGITSPISSTFFERCALDDLEAGVAAFDIERERRAIDPVPPAESPPRKKRFFLLTAPFRD